MPAFVGRARAPGRFTEEVCEGNLRASPTQLSLGAESLALLLLFLGLDGSEQLSLQLPATTLLFLGHPLPLQLRPLPLTYHFLVRPLPLLLLRCLVLAEEVELDLAEGLCLLLLERPLAQCLLLCVTVEDLF